MLFRSDGWVKTVLGQAIAGAQVYVCTQPANIVNPPTPLASIFADPLGNDPITQPDPTDGFGHYFFYVPYGTYTVIVVNGGNIQAVYPDQTIGFPSVISGVSSVFGRQGDILAEEPDYAAFYDPLGAAAAVALDVEVAGAPLSAPHLLNLANTGNVTFVDNGGGSVSASVAAVPTSSGASVFPTWYPLFQGSTDFTNFDAWGTTVVTRIPGTTITGFPDSSKVTIQINANGTETLGQLANCTVARTLLNSLTVIDHTPVTWGGTTNPTLGVGTFTSDSIALQIDGLHDYYFMWYVPFVGGNDVTFEAVTGPLCEGGRSQTTGGTGSGGAGDFTANTTLPSNLLAITGYPSILRWFAA